MCNILRQYPKTKSSSNSGKYTLASLKILCSDRSSCNLGETVGLVSSSCLIISFCFKPTVQFLFNKSRILNLFKSHFGHLNYEFYNNHNMEKFHKKLTTISVSGENYFILKQLGNTGDSFNDVLTRMLKSITPLKGDQKVGT
jgi:hypothetical protein